MPPVTNEIFDKMLSREFTGLPFLYCVRHVKVQKSKVNVGLTEKSVYGNVCKDSKNFPNYTIFLCHFFYQALKYFELPLTIIWEGFYILD